jgi:hypothetical protein
MSSSGGDGGGKGELSARDTWLTDTQALARWLDISVVKRQGRAFENRHGEFSADTELVAPEDALMFPALQVTNLEKQDMTLPPTSPVGEPTLMCFAFRHYGTNLTKSWSEPFLRLTGGRCVEIYFIEYVPLSIDLLTAWSLGLTPAHSPTHRYGFMAFAKSLFISNLRGGALPERHADTVVKFGGVRDFGADLLLPNKYTGYAFLLDGDGRVRWRASGQATEPELDGMVRAAKALRDGA